MADVYLRPVAANADIGYQPRCPCHDRPHAECPTAKPCIGGCGRLTTAFETSACGYCRVCASDPGWSELVDGQADLVDDEAAR